MTRWTILTLSQKWVKLLKNSGLYHRPLFAACIIGPYLRPVSDIRGRICNSFAGGIMVQICVAPAQGKPQIKQSVWPHWLP